MKFRFSKTAEELRRLMDLRRSSATTPTKNKKKYNRKVKHPKKDLDQRQQLSWLKPRTHNSVIIGSSPIWRTMPPQLRGQSIRFLPDWPQVRLLPRALSEALLCSSFNTFRTTTYIINRLYGLLTMRVYLRLNHLLFMKGKMSLYVSPHAKKSFYP